MDIKSKIKKSVNSSKYKVKKLIKNTKLYDVYFNYKSFPRVYEQYKYFRNHVDITDLKPATGYLRKKQKDLVKFSQEFFNEIKELNIKPFLIAGNLLGQIRYNKFIPWDDDLDFALMRNDYNKLLDFCKKHYKCLIISTKEKDCTRYVDRATKKYKNQYILFIYHNQIQISKGTSAFECKSIDFFALDYFENDYSFKQHNDFLKKIDNELNNKALTIKDKYNIVKKRMDNYKYICDSSNNIYFGIDNMDSYKKSFNTSWIDKSVLFPLKQGVFEDCNYWIPNDEISFIKYLYQDYETFPNDFGIMPHSYWEDYIHKNYINVEFYLCDAFEIFHFLPFYEALRKQGIYAVFVAEPVYINVSGSWFNYDEAVKILNDLEVEYKEICNPNAQYAVTTQDAYMLKKYKHAKKINLSYGVGLNRNNFFCSNRTTKGFDIRLVHSEFQQKKLMKYMEKQKIKIIGYPKHKDCEIKNFNIEEIRNSLGIKTEKKVIVYFPTWDEDSSVLAFANAIQKLRNEFYIVTKLHHVLERNEEKKEELKRIYEYSDMVLGGNYDFEKASMLGDIAVCDAKSGAALEVPFINTNISLVCLSVRENLDEYFYEDINSLFYITNEPDKLYNLVKEAIVYDKFKDNRVKRLEYYLGKKNENYVDSFVEEVKAGKL